MKSWRDHLNISANETAAIGDQPIDISMLEYAKLSIAMANAPEGLKRIALWVAPSNDEDGVAWAIEKMISNQYENN